MIRQQLILFVSVEALTGVVFFLVVRDERLSPAKSLRRLTV
jgi:hypothetical protein